MVTEREKMLSGLLYDPSDRELTDLRQRAFQLVERFNRLQKEDAAAQREILEALLGKMGKNVTFRAAVRFDYGCNTYVGDNCYFNFNAVFLDCAPIRIGSNVMVGPGGSFLRRCIPCWPRNATPGPVPTGGGITWNTQSPLRSRIMCGWAEMWWSTAGSRLVTMRSSARAALSPGTFRRGFSPPGSPAG